MANPAANVFVGNLPLTFMEPELSSLMEPFGTVVSTSVWKDKITLASKGFGFVQFSHPGEAAAAIAELNGAELEVGGRPLEVRLADTPEQRDQRRLQRKAVALTHAPPRFNPYQHPGAGRPAPMMPQVPAAAPGYGFGTGAVVVPKVVPQEPEPGANLYVRGLSPTVTDLHLHQLFGQFGAINSIRLEIDRNTGLPRGYAFVQFFYRHDAAQAVEGTNLLIFGDRPLQVSFHRPKGAVA